MQRRTSNDFRFTLLEVLVAMVIFGVLGTALLSGFRQAMRSTALAEDYAKAAFLARQVLSEGQVEESLQVGRREGTFGSGFPSFRWVRIATQGPETGFLQVDVQVIFTRAGDERTYRIVSGIYQTPPGES